jgi:8-oxo-dGTP pyrophosphatase MutT (NUDIX family)
MGRSVSVAIRDGERVLIVQRPADDEDLPNAWGLPAASLRGDETWTDAARRIGEKLGVELSIGRELQQGSIERKNYTLEMKLFEATMTGVPSVPQKDPNVTQYQAWKWGTSKDLEPAADRGSLCCKLFLRTPRESSSDRH